MDWSHKWDKCPQDCGEGLPNVRERKCADTGSGTPCANTIPQNEIDDCVAEADKIIKKWAAIKDGRRGSGDTAADVRGYNCGPTQYVAMSDPSKIQHEMINCDLKACDGAGPEWAGWGEWAPCNIQCAPEDCLPYPTPSTPAAADRPAHCSDVEPVQTRNQLCNVDITECERVHLDGEPVDSAKGREKGVSEEQTCPVPKCGKKYLQLSIHHE